MNEPPRVVVCDKCGRVSHRTTLLGLHCNTPIRTPTRFGEDVPYCNGIMQEPKPRTKRRSNARRKSKAKTPRNKSGDNLIHAAWWSAWDHKEYIFCDVPPPVKIEDHPYEGTEEGVTCTSCREIIVASKA